MIVPRDKLLFWFGMTVLPFATVGISMPSAVMPSILIIGIFLALALLDAISAYRRLDGISIEFPEVARMSKNREGTIGVYIRNSKAKTRQLRIVLAFPDEIYSDEDMLLDLPEGNRVSHFNWHCKPVKRGSYFFDKCYIEGLSYFGFWAVRAALPARFEIRVYPDLFFERKYLAALFLNRGNFGIHSQRHVGQGRDFEKLREYIHGDSYDHIHWKATAKRGRPITKVFQVERTQEIYVIIDASRLSGRIVNVLPEDQDSETILERFIAAALVMGVAAKRQGDLFGILCFSDKIHSFIRAKSGREHYNNCREALYALQPQIVTPDFNELCAFIGLRLRRRSLLIFLTNLDDPVISESFGQNMDLICRKHLVLVNMIKPDGMQPLFSDPDINSINDIYKNFGGHILWHNLLELGKVLQRKGVHFSLLSNEKMCLNLVSQYMDIKQRQLI
jgi:uncharacterized protein (DUF58 family)